MAPVSAMKLLRLYKRHVCMATTKKDSLPFIKPASDISPEHLQIGPFSFVRRCASVSNATEAEAVCQGNRKRSPANQEDPCEGQGRGKQRLVGRFRPAVVKESFVKNLFLGKFDSRLLTYPDPPSDNLEVINEMFTPVDVCEDTPLSESRHPHGQTMEHGEAWDKANEVELASEISKSEKFNTGHFSSDGLKRLMASTIEHVMSSTKCTQPLADFGIIQDKLSKMAVLIYAMDSVTHLTSALIGTSPDVNTSAEAAIVQIFNSENSWTQVSECLQILGSLDNIGEMDLSILPVYKNKNEKFRRSVALQGIQHIHLIMEETLRKVSDPIKNPALTFKAPLRQCLGIVVNFHEPLNLAENVHEKLKEEAKILESGVFQLSESVEQMMSGYGQKVVQEHERLEKLSDIAVDVFVMAACIGRASQSLHTGSPHVDQKVLMTKAFCYQCDKRIKQNVQDLGPSKNPNREQAVYQQIARDVFKDGGFWW